jgi:hypothetical protein
VNYPDEFGTVGVIVPQRVYTAPAGQQDFQQHGVVRFTVNGVHGIRLEDALNGNTHGLHDANTVPILNQIGQRITIRIQVSHAVELAYYC